MDGDAFASLLLRELQAADERSREPPSLSDVYHRLCFDYPDPEPGDLDRLAFAYDAARLALPAPRHCLTGSPFHQCTDSTDRCGAALAGGTPAGAPAAAFPAARRTALTPPVAQVIKGMCYLTTSSGAGSTLPAAGTGAAARATVWVAVALMEHAAGADTGNHDVPIAHGAAAGPYTADGALCGVPRGAFQDACAALRPDVLAVLPAADWRDHGVAKRVMSAVSLAIAVGVPEQCADAALGAAWDTAHALFTLAAQAGDDTCSALDGAAADLALELARATADSKSPRLRSVAWRLLGAAVEAVLSPPGADTGPSSAPTAGLHRQTCHGTSSSLARALRDACPSPPRRTAERSSRAPAPVFLPRARPSGGDGEANGSGHAATGAGSAGDGDGDGQCATGESEAVAHLQAVASCVHACARPRPGGLASVRGRLQRALVEAVCASGAVAAVAEAAAANPPLAAAAVEAALWHGPALALARGNRPLWAVLGTWAAGGGDNADTPPPHVLALAAIVTGRGQASLATHTDSAVAAAEAVAAAGQGAAEDAGAQVSLDAPGAGRALEAAVRALVGVATACAIAAASHAGDKEVAGAAKNLPDAAGRTFAAVRRAHAALEALGPDAPRRGAEAGGEGADGAGDDDGRGRGGPLRTLRAAVAAAQRDLHQLRAMSKSKGKE